jgi:hypothetical protein
MENLTNNQMNNQMYNQMYNQMNNQMYNQMNNQMYNQMNNQTNNQTNNQMNYNQQGSDKYTMEEIINIFKNNPRQYEQFNEFVTKNNINYKNSPLLNEEYLQQAAEGKIPRNIFNQFKDDNKTFYDNSNDEYSKKINISFQLSSGKKIILVASENMKLAELFEAFIKKIGFDTEILGSDIYFLYRGGRMNLDEQRSLIEMDLVDNSTILVIDVKGIIGANY